MQRADGGRHDSVNHTHIARLFTLNKKLFKLCHEETINGKKYLFSHAGLTNSWYKANKDTIGELNTSSLNALLDTDKGITTLCNISRLRGGFSPCGSVVWSDYRERSEKEDVDEYQYQVFGHTQQEEDPIITDKWAMLDCRRAFVIGDDGIVMELNNSNNKSEAK